MGNCALYLCKNDSLLTNPGPFFILVPKLRDFLPVPAESPKTMVL